MPRREMLNFAKVFTSVKSHEPRIRIVVNVTINPRWLSNVIYTSLYHPFMVYVIMASKWLQDGFKMVQVSTHFWCQKSSISGLGCGFPSIQLRAQQPVLYSTCGGIHHGHIEVADGIVHSLQLLRYLTQESRTRHTKQLFHAVPVSLCLCLEASGHS